MRFTHFNRRVAAIGLAGALAVGVVGVSFAQSPSGTPPTTPSAPTQPAGARGAHVRGAGIKELAQASGLSEDVFKQGFKDGKSINQILTQNGKSPTTVMATVLADLKTKLDKAVADGKITREKADKAYSAAQQGLPKLFERVPHTAGAGSHRAARRAGGGLLATAAKSIGIDQKALVTELKGGKTIAQVAQAHNVDPNKVIADMTAAANAKIDALVTSGKIDAAKAATMKANVAQHISTLVNQGRKKP